MWLYECLSVNANASQMEIEIAYEQIRQRWNGGGFRARIVKAMNLSYPADYAYAVLSDPGKRRAYDLNPSLYSAVTPAYLGF